MPCVVTSGEGVVCAEMDSSPPPRGGSAGRSQSANRGRYSRVERVNDGQPVLFGPVWQAADPVAR